MAITSPTTNLERFTHYLLRTRSINNKSRAQLYASEMPTFRNKIKIAMVTCCVKVGTDTEIAPSNESPIAQIGATILITILSKLACTNNQIKALPS